MSNYNSIRFKYDIETIKNKPSNNIPNFDNLIREDFLEVTKGVVPKIYNLVQSIKKQLKLEIEISTFILPNQSYGALCITDREKIKIFIYSGLVENFTLDEIRFVVAHEIGHQIFNHVPLNIAEITTSNMLMNRCQEISADRIGFFAIKDLSVVGQTIMKLLSGLSSKHLTKNFLPIFRQAKDFRNLDESSTHPNLSLRLGAIIEFSMSKEYSLLCENKDKGSFSLEDVDKRIYQKIKNLDGEDFKKALYDQLNSFNN